MIMETENINTKKNEKNVSNKTLRNKYIFLVLFVIGLVEIDIVTKVIFESQSFAIIPNFFYIQSTHNDGAGLGILSGKTTLLIVLSCIFLLGFILFDIFYKKNGKVYLLSISFIFAGALGNLIDRIFLGYVRDFLFVNIKIMPYYFNFADAILTIGIVLFAIDNIFLSKKSK